MCARAVRDMCACARALSAYLISLCTLSLGGRPRPEAIDIVLIVTTGVSLAPCITSQLNQNGLFRYESDGSITLS